MFDLLFSQPIGTSKFHGGGEYIKTVFRYLVEQYNSVAQISVFYDYDRFLDEWVKQLIEKYNIQSFDIKSVNSVTKLLQDNHIDVFYSGLAYGYKDVDFPNNTKIIGTIHGLRSLEKPCDKYTAIYSNQGIIRYIKDKIKWHITQKENNSFEQKEIIKFEKAINNFDEIITVSNHSKYAIQSLIPNISSEHLHVFYSPAKYVDDTSIEFDEYNLPEKYILILGGNRWLKNSARCIKAIESLLDKNKLNGYSIVVCGQLPKKVKEYIHHDNRYCFFDYVEPQKLECLYRNCDIFLYLSLNEGFGVPPLEAMHYGKTVITSPICSIYEVCADAVYYANPYDLKEIQNRILQASENKIPEQKAKERFNYIASKQQCDLKNLCEFIIKQEK